MNPVITDSPCACPGCDCQVVHDARYERDGKDYCSEACTNLHPGGQACPNTECQCASNVKVQDRAVSDRQLDEAIEETFPASDPISP